MSTVNTEVKNPKVLRNKSGNGYHLKNTLNEAIVIPPGAVAFFKSPIEDITAKIEDGKIDRSKGEELLARFQSGGDLDYIKLELTGTSEAN